jgi:hypothetical protein
MKFQNIEQFNSLVPECQFCGHPLKTEFSSKSTLNFTPRYNMTFDWGDNKSKNQTISYSSVEGEELLTFQYDLQGVSRPIFSVNKKTGMVIGDLTRVQKVLWDHKLSISRFCDSSICEASGNQYLSEASMLVLERMSKRLYPFFLSMEMLLIKPNDRSYGLITSYNNNIFVDKTFLVASRKNDIIAQLPIMHLHEIKGGDVITNKIKTLITFS